MDAALRFLPSGDAALTVEFGDRIDRDLNARVMALHLALKEGAVPGVVESVPTFRSLLVHYDPETVAPDALERHLAALAPDRAPPEAPSDLVTLPVCYGGAPGPDLEAVAADRGLSPEAVVRLHSSITHHVYMIGFAPGHPYLGDLPPELTLPRRQTPRTRIAAGTVAIAVGQTVIYPFQSPGGWHAIGRTPVPLFDLDCDPSALLRAGDRVRFEPIAPGEFEAIAARGPAAREAATRSAP